MSNGHTVAQTVKYWYTTVVQHLCQLSDTCIKLLDPAGQMPDVTVTPRHWLTTVRQWRTTVKYQGAAVRYSCIPAQHQYQLSETGINLIAAGVQLSNMSE